MRKIPTIEDTKPARYSVWPLAAILLIALVLRFIRLGTFPFWHDEVHNLVVSEHLVSALTTGEFISNHPPLPYILLAGWRAIGLGTNEWTLRILPALTGVCTVAALYFLVNRVANRTAALIAALLLATAPFHILHSQDLKEYVYLPCVATLMLLAFYNATESARYRDWLVYGVLAGIACYTEIFVGPLLVAINLWFLAFARTHRASIKGWFLGNTVGALMFVPWLGIMLRKVDITMVKAEHWWIPAPSLTGAAFYFKTIAFGYMAAKPFFYIATALFALLFALGVAMGLRRSPRQTALLLAAFVIPVGLVYLISLYRESIFLIRAMLPYAIAAYAIVALGIAYLPTRAIRAIVLVLVLVGNTAGLTYYYARNYPPLDFPHRPGTHPPRDYDRAAHYALDNWEDGDVMVHAAASTWMPFYWYGFRQKPHYVAGISSIFASIVNSGNPRNTPNPEFDGYFPHELQKVVQDKKRVWFAFSEWERKYLYGNAMDVWRWLDAHYVEREHTYYRGIELFLYETPAHAPAPITTGRDNDDGASNTLLVDEGGTLRSYLRNMPDDGLIESTLAQRRGALTLRFDQAGPREILNLAETDSTRTISVAVENTRAGQVNAIMEVVASDVLIEAASLLEETPDSDTWRTGPKYNTMPPPVTHEVTLNTACVEKSEHASIIGSVSLSSGEYTSAIYLPGTPGDDVHALAGGVRAVVGNVDILGPVPRSEPSRFGWQWFSGARVTATDIARIPIRIESTGEETSMPRYLPVGYISFRRVREQSSPTSIAPQTPGAIVVKGNEKRSWSIVVDKDIKRVDVWVYELGEGGKAHRIFTQSGS